MKTLKSDIDRVLEIYMQPKHKSSEFAMLVGGYCGLYERISGEVKNNFKLLGYIDSILATAFNLGVEFEKIRAHLDDTRTY